MCWDQRKSNKSERLTCIRSGEGGAGGAGEAEGEEVLIIDQCLIPNALVVLEIYERNVFCSWGCRERSLCKTIPGCSQLITSCSPGEEIFDHKTQRLP